MIASTGNAHMAKLADTLWHERCLLEYLLFKLVSADLVLTSDDQRFVGAAIAEVDAMMTAIRQAGARRSDLAATVAHAWNVPPCAVSFAFLVENAPGSLRATFEDHQTVFEKLAGEIEQLAGKGGSLPTVGLDGILGTLGYAGGDVYDNAGYDDGILASNRQSSRLEDVGIAEAAMEMQLQETAYEAALAAFVNSPQTSLADFLR